MHKPPELLHGELELLVYDLVVVHPTHRPGCRGTKAQLHAVRPQIQHVLHRTVGAADHEPLYEIFDPLVEPTLRVASLHRAEMDGMGGEWARSGTRHGMIWRATLVVYIDTLILDLKWDVVYLTSHPPTAFLATFTKRLDGLHGRRV